MTNPALLPGPGLPPHAVALLQRGGAIIYQDAYVVTIKLPDARVNHAVRGLITVLTCGAWGIFWLVAAVSAPKGSTITVPRHA